MKPKRKERHRSTKLELLGGVPAPVLRALRDIACKADLPLERVFRDVLAIGISVVTDPVASPYQSLIAFRSELAAKQAELENVERATIDAGPPRGGGAETFSEPDLSDEADQGLVAELAEENLGEGSDNAFERSGFGPEVGADSVGDDKPETEV